MALPRVLAEVNNEAEARHLIDTVDQERIAFIRHYFNAEWPSRHLYHAMLNTAAGEDATAETILSLSPPPIGARPPPHESRPRTIRVLSARRAAGRLRRRAGLPSTQDRRAGPMGVAQAGGETNPPAGGAAWWKSFHDAELDSLIVAPRNQT